MFGLPISTLRYYDKQGLFPEMERVSGIRKFSDTELEALRVIECLKKSGLEIKDIKQFMDVCDGFLFTGGPDINPFLFGEDTHLKCGNISAARDHLEFRLLSAAMDAGKPIFGICRGVQVLNVGLGGSLYQDIPSQTEREFPIAHQQPFYYNIPCHRVNITENTLLHSICHGETQIAVNSSHHQCVHIPAPGLVVSAVAPDGIIEAVEKPDYPNFFLGVQWHPEYLWDRDEAAMGLFQAFVDACK